MANPTNLPGDLTIVGNMRMGGAFSPTLSRSDVLAQGALQPFTIPLEVFKPNGDIGMTCGTGITESTAAVCSGRVSRSGTGLIKTEVFIDLTGLTSGETAGDIIGDDGVANCHIGRITNAVNGLIVYGQVTCLETPATGDNDIDFYGTATEATGTQDAAVSDLTDEIIMLNGGDWTAAVATPVALVEGEPNEGYMYLTSGQSEGAATYTGGQFLLELWGVPANSLDYAVGTHGTNAPSLQTNDCGGNAAATSYYARGEIVVPWEYEAGESMTLRLSAGMLELKANVTATVDIAVYKSDEDSLTSGSDICATAAVSDNMNSETFVDVDFVITPTSLNPGDLLDVLITVTVDDDTDSDEIRGCIGSVQLLCDVR